MNKNVYIISVTSIQMNNLLLMLATILSLSLGVAAPVSASNWQLMLVPESVEITSQEGFDNSFTSFNPSFLAIEQGLTISLTRSLEKLIEQQKVFDNCKQYLCGQKDIAGVMEKVRNSAPSVHLIVLYGYGGEDKPTLYVRLLDPLSLQVMFSDSLALVGSPSPASLRSLGQDMGTLIQEQLSVTQPQSEFALYFDSFLFDELNGFTTMVLANNQNTQLVLSKSFVSYHLFEQYFPVTNSEYILQTSLNASQVKQLLAAFFTLQNVNSNINFSQKENANMAFTMVRQGNPYAPSLITRALIIIGLFSILGIYFRRKHLDFYLVEYGKKRNADMWLTTYKKASFVLYALRSKWISQSSYWARLQKESSALSAQAKLYFDAGDVNTSKLFVSKSLHANRANLEAKKLVQDIEALEENAKSFSESEQWIRNKLAKAMNNYRQQQPIKALRQLYQAVAVAQQEASLKKQTKAINKLIKQVNKEFTQSISSVVISCSKDPQSVLLCENATVHLGRRPNNDDETWISKQDAVYFVNHKSVSRAGQHGFVQKQDSGFYWVDTNSKNGTFINNQLTTPHQPEKLHNKDRVQLGGKNIILSTALDVDLSENESILQLTLNLQSMTLLDKQELNRVWPDNALAIRTKLVLLQTKCWLVLNTLTSKMHICEVGCLPVEKRHLTKTNNGKDKFVPLCTITLGKCAAIAPVELANKIVDITLDSMPLLGEMPLYFPCSLMYGDIQFQIIDYDSASIRYNHGPIMPSASAMPVGNDVAMNEEHPSSPTTSSLSPKLNGK
ncbi:MAG: pSer/pThr/pTyr-binding forkhead associated (FHA) protein [Kangiellaceae bacterium]|jgi:pSer/pThr/pTyr-binding forkhead associated (FHA) protein